MDIHRKKNGFFNIPNSILAILLSSRVLTFYCGGSSVKFSLKSKWQIKYKEARGQERWEYNGQMVMDTLDSMWLSWHGRTHQTDFGDIGDQGGLKEI